MKRDAGEGVTPTVTDRSLAGAETFGNGESPANETARRPKRRLGHSRHAGHCRTVPNRPHDFRLLSIAGHRTTRVMENRRTQKTCIQAAADRR
jgi:hypothetical protein